MTTTTHNEFMEELLSNAPKNANGLASFEIINAAGFRKLKNGNTVIVQLSGTPRYNKFSHLKVEIINPINGLIDSGMFRLDCLDFVQTEPNRHRGTGIEYNINYCWWNENIPKESELTAVLLDIDRYIKFYE